MTQRGSDATLELAINVTAQAKPAGGILIRIYCC